jgi:glutathione synthase/RimK-type ligase-like ATP-grasp enzyme
VGRQRKAGFEGEIVAKKIGILFGRERSFPPALEQEINKRGEGKVVAEAVRVGALRQDVPPGYDLILDRISHEVPFYRSYVKAAVAMGAQVVNNPFWWSADDKFLCNIIARSAGVAVPKTVLLPHKQNPPNTSGESFSNLEFPLDWDGVFSYLGFPIFLKPADGGGWRDVYKVHDPEAFFQAYDRTRELCMMAQEGIEFTEYYRCYVLGRERVRLMRYDPKAPFERRYVQNAPPTEASLLRRIEKDCLALCDALGYDFNTVEFAVRGGVPVAIDFMNPAPDCDLFSIGQENFDWVLASSADFLIERARAPRPFETTGSWPKRIGRAAEAV